MGVVFVLGRAGTGKTHFCIESAAKELLDPARTVPLVLLVPEQATYQAEQAILSQPGIEGFSRLKVLSFDRLRYMLLGSRCGRTEIGRIARQMLVRRILLANSDRLRIFGPSAQTAGLAGKLSAVIEQLYQSGFDVSDINSLADRLSRDKPGEPVSLKFADIASVFEEFSVFISGQDERFFNPDAQLEIASEAVRTADFLAGAVVWVDGFSGFSGQEMVLLSGVLSVAGRSYIALCLDPAGIDTSNPRTENLDPTSLFAPTERTFAELFHTVQKLKLVIEKPVILGEARRFGKSGPLGYLEKNIFRTPGADTVSTGGRIEIIGAPDPRAEVVWVARKISGLVRGGQLRYRDIAVIASEPGDYRHYVEAVFDDYGIPFFLDQPRGFDRHVVVELLSSALNAAAGQFSAADVMSYLKSGFSPLSRQDIDMLENYCLAFGVNNKHDWFGQRQWNFAGSDDTQFDNQRIDLIRQEAMAPLRRLAQCLGANAVPQQSDPLYPQTGPAENSSVEIGRDGLIDAEQFVCAVWEFLEGLNVGEKLDDFDRQDQAGRQENRQLFEKLVGILDEIAVIFDAQPMPAWRYVSIFCDALASVTCKLIPATLDEVLVGSIERSRHPELKAVFLLGATQKSFPESVSFDELLGDEDKAVAGSYDMVLADTIQQRLLVRQYLSYIAFTRASDYLYITYPATDAKGRPAELSAFVRNLKSLYSGLEVRCVGSVCSSIGDVLSVHELSEYLCGRLAPEAFVLGRTGPATGDDAQCLSADTVSGDERRQAAGILACLCRDQRMEVLGRNIRCDLGYDNSAVLDDKFVRQYIGRGLTFSPSRLHSFASCPYRHFAEYILMLEERKIFRFEPIDIGRFYHDVLDELFCRLDSQGLDFGSAEGEHLARLCDECTKVITENTVIGNFAGRNAFNHYIIDSAAQTLRDFVGALSLMAKAGSFIQKASEWRFGADINKAGRNNDNGLVLETPSGRLVSVVGRIDRVDTAVIDGRRVGLVFDYKRKGQSFSWNYFYHGLNMQLVIYMLSVQTVPFKGKVLEGVVGAFFLPVEPDINKGRPAGKKKPPAAAAFLHRASGVFDGQFAAAIDSTAARRSSFYGFSRSKKDDVYSDYYRSDVLRPEDFGRVIGYARRKIISFAESIYSGDIRVRPYKLTTKSACKDNNVECPYRGLCRFDWQINDYNILERLGKKKALEKMEAPDGR